MNTIPSDYSYKIDILLSTYNGDRYLQEQLDSIFNQTFTDWRLIIRDDGSQDQTLNIVKKYIQRYPNKVLLMTVDGNNLGPCASFQELMNFSSAPYVMFCDQDDVWLNEKISLSLEKMMRLEGQFGKEIPLLVYTNSLITDKDLNVISDATETHVGLGLEYAVKFRNLILRNVISGNSVLMNKSLLRSSCPIPSGAYMHDWWVALVASAFGRIGYVSDPTILYRQHGQNMCGLEKLSLIKSLLTFNESYKKYFKHQTIAHDQIKAFYERFSGDELSKSAVLEFFMAEPLANLERLGFWKRKEFLIGFYKECPYRLKSIVDLILFYKILWIH